MRGGSRKRGLQLQWLTGHGAEVGIDGDRGLEAERVGCGVEDALRGQARGDLRSQSKQLRVELHDALPGSGELVGGLDPHLPRGEQHAGTDGQGEDGERESSKHRGSPGPDRPREIARLEASHARKPEHHAAPDGRLVVFEQIRIRADKVIDALRRTEGSRGNLA